MHTMVVLTNRITSAFAPKISGWYYTRTVEVRTMFLSAQMLRGKYFCNVFHLEVHYSLRVDSTVVDTCAVALLDRLYCSCLETCVLSSTAVCGLFLSKSCMWQIWCISQYHVPCNWCIGFGIASSAVASFLLVWDTVYKALMVYTNRMFKFSLLQNFGLTININRLCMSTFWPIWCVATCISIKLKEGQLVTTNAVSVCFMINC